jgi:DNA repair protein RadA/Sms
VALADVEFGKTQRLSTGLGEVDTVLGGGLVPGSLVLLGGDPGIGKSTLALQLAHKLEWQKHRVLYVSGEESAQQIKLRNSRVSETDSLRVLAETNLEVVLATLEAEHPDVAIIDSIQTIYSSQASGVIGGVSQLSFTTNSLMRLAKSLHITIIIIGHVTKEGVLAGPKMIEHMVDVVLYLEGDRYGDLRLLRTSKNRFGGVGEVGVLKMGEGGLEEVPNIAGLFLGERTESLPGSCVTAVLEGNKVLLLEVQALTSTSNFGYPKRATSGFDVNRLQLLVAILQKTLKVNLSNQDIYVNVAGGFKIDERAADLPVALAILSSYYGVALPAGLAASGEIGLLGEVRIVTQLAKRQKELAKLQFKELVTAGTAATNLAGLKVTAIRNLQDIRYLFKGAKESA